jgi:hypothetical protein
MVFVGTCVVVVNLPGISQLEVQGLDRCLWKQVGVCLNSQITKMRMRQQKDKLLSWGVSGGINVGGEGFVL